MIRKRILIYSLVVLFFLVTSALFGANVLVPQMDLTSFINLKGEIATRGEFDLTFDGGYKYQGKLGFEYLNADLENNTAPSLIFDGAQASVNDLFKVLDLTYWTGYYGVIGEADHYKGHLYHREGGFDYDGYLPLLGTGIIMGTDYWERYGGKIYLYQRYGSNSINSLDLAFDLSFEPYFFSLLTGLTGEDFRLGLRARYLGDVTDFYITIGNPTIDGGRMFDYDNFYFLLEEWFRIKNWNLILSIFSRPKEHYNYLLRDYADTDEVNDIDFNFNLNYEPESSYFSAGGELNIQTNKTEEFGIFLSPYFSFITLGINWKVKVDFNILGESRDFVTAFLNVNASF
jgi:hypothetical protein